MVYGNKPSPGLSGACRQIARHEFETYRGDQIGVGCISSYATSETVRVASLLWLIWVLIANRQLALVTTKNTNLDDLARLYSHRILDFQVFTR